MPLKASVKKSLQCGTEFLCHLFMSAFRPSGSTTSAIISILQTVTQLLADNDYVMTSPKHLILFVTPPCLKSLQILQSQITPTTGLCNSSKDILTVQSSETKLLLSEK